MKAEITGDTNQLSTIVLSLDQSMVFVPAPTIPAPIKEPTTVCVPDIGIPNNDELNIKKNEARLAPNIICSCVMTGN